MTKRNRKTASPTELTAPTPAGSRTEPVHPPDDGMPDVALPPGLRIVAPMGPTPEGTLYHAEDPAGRQVALLLSAPESGEANGSRRELLERATRIQHVNVARIYEVGELDDGSLYVVLEKVGGEPLAELLAAGHILPFPEARGLALQIADGLQAAHRAGFVHGNLWPGAILVTGNGDGHTLIKLIGFELDPALGQRGAAVPVKAEASEYASPERLAGHPPDERSEVYSLGAILHHVLTGTPPESGKVHDVVPGVIRKVLATALAAAPNRRFRSVSQLQATLERLAGVTGAGKSRGRRILERGVVAVALLALAVGASLMPRSGLPSPLAGDQPATTAGSAGPERVAAALPPSGAAPAAADEAAAVDEAAAADEPSPVNDPGAADESGTADELGTVDESRTADEPVAGDNPGAPIAPRPSARSAPTRSPSPADSTSRADAMRARSTPLKAPRTPAVARAAPDPGVARPQPAPPAAASPAADGPTETGMVGTSPRPDSEPESANMEDRAQVYVRIGLDEASRQLGRPVHAVEGMSPLFYGLALSRIPPFSDARRPVVRSVYMGPNESLILLDQQRVRPGAKVPLLGGNSWRVGDIILYLHGDARPEVMKNLRRRVR